MSKAIKKNYGFILVLILWCLILCYSAYQDYKGYDKCTVHGCHDCHKADKNAVPVG